MSAKCAMTVKINKPKIFEFVAQFTPPFHC